MVRLTLVEKIATRFGVGLDADGAANCGEYVNIRPRHVMTHDNTGAVIPKFLGLGAPGMADPRQPVFIIDHDIQNRSEENLAKYAKIEAFAAEHGVDFHPPGTGISHQVMMEKGYVTPGSMVVGSDSHSNIYGAMSALGTPVVRTDAAAIWATGETWWQVPPVARVELRGTLQPGVVGKDVIIALCGLFNDDEVLNHAVEFTGEGVGALSMDQRMSVANMTTEWGALAGVFPFDDVLRDHLYERADYFGASEGHIRFTRSDVDTWFRSRLEADPDAVYSVELTLDLSTVIPHVSGPNHVKTMTALPDIEARRVAVQKAYLLSCVNARDEDIVAAAEVVRGKRVADGVEFYIAAASAEVQARVERSGHWQALVDAGAIALPSGCGPCIGLGRGTIADGETGISATNRNFKGRMGSREAEVYLASPAVVAASAVAGYICSPSPFGSTQARYYVQRNPAPVRAVGEVKILDGFPGRIEGRALYLRQDNLNTDGIYAGKWTYKDDMTPEQMAAVIFENYDEGFDRVYRKGDIIVGGRNFGTGSSREQAATALKHRGVPLVIAASFSETYKRNAFNNGVPVIDCPELVDHLSAALPGDDPTSAGPDIAIDFRRSQVLCDGREFRFAALGPVPQALIVADGAEALVRNRLDGA